MRVLLVEDYTPLRNSLAQGLREAGFAVDAVADGADGQAFAESGDFDAVILDIMLPKIDGLTVLQTLRARCNQVPVILLTAKDTLDDRVRGLNLGADDYLVKPFAFPELLARVNALVRRKYNAKSTQICVGDIEIDTSAKSVRRAGRAVVLTANEFHILEFLAMRPGRVATRDMIWQRLYDFDAEPSSNVIEVFIANLRRKLEEDGASRIIHTRRGLGYVLTDEY